MADNNTSILDFLTNNWHSLLGLPATDDTGGIATGKMPPPAPPPSAMAGAGSFSPSGAADAPNWGVNEVTGGPNVIMPQAGGFQGGPLAGRPPPPAAGPDSAIAAPSPPPPTPGGQQQQPINVPLPSARPPNLGGPPAAPGYSIAGPTGPAPANVQPNMGISGQPAPMPPPGAYGPGTPTSTAGSLNSALGMPQPPRQNTPLQDAFTRGLAGLGKGLSAVGAMKPGTPGAGAFAAGAGGGLTGGINEGNLQQQQARQAGQDFFHDTIAADNQVMKDKLFPLNVQHLMASTDYLNRRYNVASPGSHDAWFLSDVGRMKLADQAFHNWETNQRQILKEKREAGIDTTKELEDLDKTSEGKKAEIYKNYRVDPTSYQGSEKNPIDVSRLTEEQLATMPAGTWFKYKDKNGVERTTTRDYTNRPNPREQQQQPQMPQSQLQEQQDDQEAMQRPQDEAA